jgi:hypothetical protein
MIVTEIRRKFHGGATLDAVCLLWPRAPSFAMLFNASGVVISP